MLTRGDRDFVTTRWGWKYTGRLPFDPWPPIKEPAALASYFEGRTGEIESAVRTPLAEGVREGEAPGGPS
jgi:hypothetical protein